MSNGNDIEYSGPPIDVFATSIGGDLSSDIATLDAVLAEARRVNDAADEAIGMALAGCIVECQDADNACYQCINGQLDVYLANLAKVDDKITNKVKDAVQSALSIAIGVGLNTGIPIQELLGQTNEIQVVNEPTVGVPAPNQAILETPQASVPLLSQTTQPPQINLADCPAGWYSVTNIFGNRVCVQNGTPQTVVDRIIRGEINAPDPSQIPPPVTPPTVPTQPQPGSGSLPLPNTPICTGTLGNDPLIPFAQWMQGKDVNSFTFGTFEDSQAYLRGEPMFAFIGLGGTVVLTQAGTTCGGLPPSNPNCPPCNPTGGTGPTEPFAVSWPTPSVGTNLCNLEGLSEVIDSISTFSISSGWHAAFAAGTVVAGSINIADAFTRQNVSVPSTSPLAPPTSTTTITSIDPSKLGGVVSNLITGVAGALLGGVLGKLFKSDFVNTYGESCNTNTFQDSQFALGFLKLVGAVPGMVPDQWKQTAQYVANYICPYLIPGAVEANALWTKGFINEKQWSFLVRSDARCEDWERLIREAGQALPTADQLAIARRREIIKEDEYKDLLRKIGIVSPLAEKISYQLTEFVPSPSDIVRFMVRDAFDETLNTNQVADRELPQKYTEKAKAWARDQGIPDEVFKFFWRAHYEYPSNTALFEMLHRLRNDGIKLPDGTPVDKVTVQDIAKVIQINDMAPDWVNRLLAISYSPLTRVDARRAFEVGDLTADELEEAYLDLGSSPKNAKTLRKFAETTSGPIRAKKLGHASTSEVLEWYRSYVISRETAAQLLEKSGIKPDAVGTYLETEDNRLIAKDRKAQISALKSRYMKGEFSVSQATDQLLRAGVDNGRIGDLLFTWSNLRDARYKSPTVGMLCKWWSNGYITISEYQRRVENLGFTLEDASRIIQSCQQQDSERKQAEAEKLAKLAQQSREKQIRELRRIEREQKAAVKEAQRLAKEQAPCKPPPKPTCPTPGQPESNGQAAS